jgi:uncharacterized protein (DUF362 family)
MVMADKYKVIIRRCDGYENVDRIRGIIREGMEELGARPHGKVLLKPNFIFAHKRYGRYGCTEPRMLEAMIDVMGAMPEVDKITIGERTAVTVPTRYIFSEGGFSYLAQKPKVELCFFDEAELVEVPLHKGTLHKSLHLARALAEADYKVWAPKLKHHASSKLTHALKLNIGILNAHERLAGHDWRLEEKIADLYEAGHPDLVISDAIVIGQQAELVPKPLNLGVVMMGTSGVAMDIVGARLIGFEPDEIEHLRLARSRGWPPVSEDDVEIVSEVPFEQLLAKTRNFDRTYNDAREVDTPVRVYIGHRPGGTEQCHTGCHNMMKTALAIMEANRPGCLKQARPIAVVIGEYDGDVDGQGLPILLVGGCTKINGKTIGKTTRIGGCPVVVPVFMSYGAHYFKVPNPYFDPAAMWKLPYFVARTVAAKIKNRGLFKADFMS